jgi:hypothetical protein
MLAFATSLAACAGHTSPSASASGTPGPASRPENHVAHPVVEATTSAPVPDASAAAAGPATATLPSPTATARGPRIITLSASPAIVHAGGSIALRVHTSADVASVTGTVSAYTLPFTRTSPGRFELAFAIPANVPGFFHGTYAMNVTARASGGASDTRSVAITFQ